MDEAPTLLDEILQRENLFKALERVERNAVPTAELRRMGLVSLVEQQATFAWSG